MLKKFASILFLFTLSNSALACGDNADNGYFIIVVSFFILISGALLLPFAVILMLVNQVTKHLVFFSCYVIAVGLSFTAFLYKSAHTGADLYFLALSVGCIVPSLHALIVSYHYHKAKQEMAG